MDASTLIQTFGFPIFCALAIGFGFVKNWVVSGLTHTNQAAQFERQLTTQAAQFQARIDDMTSQRDLLLDANMKNAHAADLALRTTRPSTSARGAS